MLAPASLAEQYREIWRHTQYRRFAPGERHVDAAIEALRPPMGASFVDFGCGTGRGAGELRKRGYGVLGVDFADNCLDEGVDIPLLVADLAGLTGLSAEYGYCTDVMEHIEPERVDDVLMSICQSVRQGVYFSIAVTPDAFGPLLCGKPLHLTVKDVAWWRERLERHWPRVEVLTETPAFFTAACFTFPPRARVNVVVEAPCNTDTKTLLAHVACNSRRDIPWLAESPPHDGHAVLVGGGPSLAGMIEELRHRVAQGQTVFALNDAANFLLAHGIRPEWQMVLDARPDNVRFVTPRPARRYLIGSQVHPTLLDELQGEDVTLFHYGMEGIKEHLASYPGRKVCLLAGAYVLGPIAMCAVYAMGYRKLHLYGYDSCDAPTGEAHAYAQRETAAEEKRLEVHVAGRPFRCSFGMFKQAEQFPALAQMLADAGCILTVHGDGLLQALAREMSSPAGGEGPALSQP